LRSANRFGASFWRTQRAVLQAFRISHGDLGTIGVGLEFHSFQPGTGYWRRQSSVRSGLSVERAAPSVGSSSVGAAPNATGECRISSAGPGADNPVASLLRSFGDAVGPQATKRALLTELSHPRQDAKKSGPGVRKNESGIQSSRFEVFRVSLARASERPPHPRSPPEGLSLTTSP